MMLRNWPLLDQIYGLLLGLHVIDQSNRKIAPYRYKSVISGMPNLFFRAKQQNYARFLTYYRHFIKHVEKTCSGSEKLLSARVISVPI